METHRRAKEPNANGKDSPEREILTPRGCQALFAVGERALTLLMKQGLPYIETSNSQLPIPPRHTVIEWAVQESRKPKTKPVY